MKEPAYNLKALAALAVFKGIYTRANYFAYNRECRNQLELQRPKK
jgi:hypothetical protein